MLQRRDIESFFTVISVLSNPERAKSELAIYDLAAKDAEERKLVLDARETELRNREAVVRTVLAERTAFEVAHHKKAEALTQVEKSLNDLRNDLTQREDAVHSAGLRLGTLQAELDQRMQSLDARESAVASKEVAITARMARLAKDEADYRDKIAKLKQAVA